MVIIVPMTLMSFDSFEGVSFIAGFFGFLMHNLPNLAILLSVVVIRKNILKGYTQILISVIFSYMIAIDLVVINGQFISLCLR